MKSILGGLVLAYIRREQGFSLSASATIRESQDLLRERYGDAEVDNWWKDADRAIKMLEKIGL